MYVCAYTPIMFISLYNIYINYIVFLYNGIEKLYFTIYILLYKRIISIDFIVLKTNELCLTFHLQLYFIGPNWQLYHLNIKQTFRLYWTACSVAITGLGEKG